MRRGCIASEEIQCGECQQVIRYAERYLALDEEDGAEVQKGKVTHYCVACAVKKGYAQYKEEKGERVLTFFT